MEGEKAEQHVAQLNSNVLIDINNGDRLTFARLHSSATAKIGNTRVSLTPLVGSPYGAVFELQKGPQGLCLVRIPPSIEIISDQASEEPAIQEDRAAADGNVAADIIQRDNRSLVDDNTAQKLSADDISRMRRDCTLGKEIVEALVAHSTTFQNKTVYSQEKYKRKKAKKYAPCLVLRRPSARRICEAYFMKCPQKIGFLRVDMLGLMLSLANVGAHAEVLVMDMLGGLLTAGIAERIGGFGSVCSVYDRDKPHPMDIVGLLNLSNTMSSRVFRASIWKVSEAFKKSASSDTGGSSEMCGLSETCNVSGTQTDSCDITLKDPAAGMSEGKDVESALVGEGSAIKAEPVTFPVSGNTGLRTVPAVVDGIAVCTDAGLMEEDHGVEKKVASANTNGIIRPGRYASSADVSKWAKQGFTSLLIGAPELEPWSMAQELLPLLRSSASFVIYHPYLQPLVQCMHQLQANRIAVALEILEPWLREYQVLPSRTHPHMQMNSNGGYVLTGVKVACI